MAILGTVCGSAPAATYYVASSGDDSASGARTRPWATLQRAASSARGGDTVWIEGGTYSGRLRFSASGTATERIVFRVAPGQAAVLDGRGAGIGAYGGLVTFQGASCVTLDGLEVRNSSHHNILITGESTHLQLLNLNVHGSQAGSGIYVEGPASHPAFTVIANNQVHDNAIGGITLYDAPGGFYRIENNTVYNNLGTGNFDGIQVGGGGGSSHHIVVKGNHIYGNGGNSYGGQDPLDLGGHRLNHHYLVEGNDVDGGTGFFKLHSGDVVLQHSYIPGVSGFHIARFNRFTNIGYVSYDFPNPNVIYNNTFFDCGQCFMIWGEAPTSDQNVGDPTWAGGDAGRMNVKNNIFYQTSTSLTSIQQASSYSKNMLLLAGPAGSSIDATYRSVRLRHNLYAFAPNQMISWTRTFGPPVSAEAFTAYQASNAPDLPDVGSMISSQSPSQMFVDASTRNYALVAGSAAIDAGMPLTTATNTGAKSKSLVVDRASYFQDGYCTEGECLNTPDRIVVGRNPPVAIVSIDDASNRITLSSPLSWSPGDPVTLPYAGAAPDVGAFEYGAAAPQPKPSPSRPASATPPAPGS